MTRRRDSRDSLCSIALIILVICQPNFLRNTVVSAFVRNTTIQRILLHKYTATNRIVQHQLHESNLPEDTNGINLITGTVLPNPKWDAEKVVTICMEALKTMKESNKSLEICFNFSSDRCRIAMDGKFVQCPVFGSLIHCQDYEVLSVGPIIKGTRHRGDMQTILLKVTKGFTINDVLKEATTNKQQQQEKQQLPDDNKTKKFLWTLQKERRPPQQDCWLVHEVLYTKNAFSQTE